MLARLVSGMIEDEAARALDEAGLDVHFGVRHPERDFGLAADLAWMFGPEADRLVRIYLDRHDLQRALRRRSRGRKPSAREELPGLVRVFEKERPTLRAALDEAAADLRRMARSLWHDEGMQ